MLEERAVVVATLGRFCWVETQRRSTCDACAVSKGCGTAALAKLGGSRHTKVRALNDAAAEVGDTVVVGLNEQALLRASLAVYMAPLLFLLVFAMAGQHIVVGLPYQDLAVAGSGLVGFGLGLAWVRYFSHRVSADSRYQATVLRKL
ncbi:hypothetical protein CAI21_12270 [Alkalilimnicola ehrlichii]|uniref:Positive regulator of sigma(E), RseC/MucC n=1 Tax=Alkalilimnicola ehrlichii TaxID=351052 RepID=A0A3E0X074_9GAMM|nr:SoxR reducing system RseC family protein [Alkalilimnicola ehrlichii]RFA28350.1 hypothetical protein CAI21_12270 [Alkalilimnicola ehrlichii]RFA38585.1 hypothetical protein CAL65_04390 [Alkalilimnicola ehrlichii]